MSDRVVSFVPGREVRLPGQDTPIKGYAAPFTEHVRFADVYAAAAPADLAAALGLVQALLPEPYGPQQVPGPQQVRAALVTAPAGMPEAEEPLGWVARFSRPFRIAEAPGAKIADSLGWMHTYLSRAAARAGRRAEDLFTAYAALLKCDDYRLARLVTPNVSMLLQRRLIGLLAPQALAADLRELHRRNAAALTALDALAAAGEDRDLVRACGLATFSGTTSFGADDRDPTVAEREQGLDTFLAGTAQWGTDQRPAFVGAALAARHCAVILDDAGEVVFDLSLLQALLQANPELRVSLLARERQGGIDATASEVDALVDGGRLPALRRFRAEGRVSVHPVGQELASFEPELFTAGQRRLLDSADLVLVKGAGFFETTVLDRPAFHAFVVEGLSSRLLTGQPGGRGMFRLVTGPERQNRGVAGAGARGGERT